MSNRICIICQTELTGRQQNACSPVCANKVYANRRREAGRLKTANLAAEQIQLKRDAQARWRKANKKLVACPVCGVDHIVPQSLSLKPDHSEQNLRLTHLVCNAYRSNNLQWVADDAHKALVVSLMQAKLAA